MYPVKNVSGILMEIPCHLCRHKSTEVWSKSTPNSMTIPCYLSRFYFLSMLEHDMDFGQVRVMEFGQVRVMEFPWHLLRKWWDFPCGFGLIPEPNQTAVKKTWENPCHIFYRDLIVSHPQSIFSFPFHVICQRIDTTCLGWVKIFQVRFSFIVSSSAFVINARGNCK